MAILYATVLIEVLGTKKRQNLLLTRMQRSGAKYR
jgi:hypothetical protein